MRAARGFSLIEAAIVLGIVGLVIGGIWVAASTVSRNMTNSRMLEATLVMIEKAQRIYKGKPPFSGSTDLDATFIAAGIVPRDLVNGTSIRSPWGGTITIGGNSTTITFTYEMKVRDCFTFAPLLVNALAKTSDFKRGKISLDIYDSGLPAGATPQQIVQQCDAEDYGPDAAGDFQIWFLF